MLSVCVCVVVTWFAVVCARAPIAQIVIASRFVTTISLKIRWTHWYIWKIYNTMCRLWTLSFAWSLRVCSRASSPPPYARHLALSLSLFVFAFLFIVGFSSIFFSHLRFVYIILHSLIEVSKCCNDPNIANGLRTAVLCVCVNARGRIFISVQLHRHGK